MLDEVEMDGEICRDDGGAGVDMFSSESLGTAGGGEVHYWVNIFRGYVWDGQERQAPRARVQRPGACAVLV